MHMLIAFLLTATSAEHLGKIKSQALREMSLKSKNNVISLTASQINEYMLTFPRPYDLVLYFTHRSSGLGNQLRKDFLYMAELYVNQGCLYPSADQTGTKSSVYFVQLQFKEESKFLFNMFDLKSVPNIIVSKPRMAILAENEKSQYFKQFLWEINLYDGHVTTHKMLEFVNKRTGRSVHYKPTTWAMLQVLIVFVAICAAGYYALTRLRSIWMNTDVWLVCSMAIYVICSSGIFYDIIHDVPFVGMDKAGNIQFFSSGGGREQYAAEGFFVALMTMGVAVGLVLLSKVHKMTDNSFSQSVVFCVLSSMVIIVFVMVENCYRSKSWYAPSFFPPPEYPKGSVFHDQGHNI